MKYKKSKYVAWWPSCEDIVTASEFATKKQIAKKILKDSSSFGFKKLTPKEALRVVEDTLKEYETM